MKPTKITTTAIAAILATIALTGCQSAASTTTAGSAPTGQTTTTSGPVLPVNTNPITNTATAPTLEITYAALEDNVDPATNKAIKDRLEVTLKNTGTTALTGFEIYYEMTDVTTGATEAYYSTLDGLSVAPGAESTIYFDNETGPGHYPENTFSLYRSSANEVDMTIQVSAPGSKIATATAKKGSATGEKAD
ncbi:hypothetical protein [Pengzhenrongella phosphoraccumulans]|uniref:hypothetical protein n=1 Tax=Pengzhenrongella phosphoraccumulans TaxID=3114394 RepID=UPI00388DAEAB